MTGSREFEGVFRRAVADFYASITRYVQRLSGDAELAADVTQEAFIKLYQRGAMPEEPRSWLVSVANNLMRDEHRRTSRRSRLLAVSGNDAPGPATPPWADAALDREERRTAVRRALETLSERDRQLLLLRYEGLSYRELATTLALPAASVGTMLARAKAAFQLALEGPPDASE